MAPEPTYTVFIRVAGPRGDFVDPPPVSWNDAKDDALWKTIHPTGSATQDIDWNELAARFEVTVDFLSQQVTYLTERHAKHVQAQVRKAQSAARNTAPSPAPGSESATAMARTASGQGISAHGRAPSQLSLRKEPPASTENTAPNTPKLGAGASSHLGGLARPPISHAASSNTAIPPGHSASAAGSLRSRTGNKPPSPRPQLNRPRLSSLTTTSPPAQQNEGPGPTSATNPASPGPASPSEDDESSDESSSPEQSRIIRRPPRFQPRRDRDGPKTAFDDDMEDDEVEPAFLPFSGKGSGDMGGSSTGDGGITAPFADPTATLRGNQRDFAANAARRLQNTTGSGATDYKGKGKEKGRTLQQSNTSDSSTNSAAFAPKRPHGDRQQPSNPLSPRRTAELKGKGISREGSDGTPSMGSSFSDLDDASVTQSALEEALASKMQGGTLGSTISNVFRSRVLPRHP